MDGLIVLTFPGFFAFTALVQDKEARHQTVVKKLKGAFTSGTKIHFNKVSLLKVTVSVKEQGDKTNGK